MALQTEMKATNTRKVSVVGNFFAVNVILQGTEEIKLGYSE